MTWSSRARQPASRISAFVHGAADDDTRDSVTHLPNELLVAQVGRDFRARRPRTNTP